MTRVVALVPMRHDSERVPGKNRRDFAGRPLWHHVTSTLLACPSVDEVVIDTDSDTIIADAASWERVRTIRRPEHLLGGDVPMNAILLHDVEQVPADLYLQTHSTNPLLRAATVERAIGAFLDARPDHDSLFTVTRLQTRLYDAAGNALNHDPGVLLRTQDLPPVFEENSNLYVFTADVLRQRGNRIGARPMMFEVDPVEAQDIDVELDFLVAEFLHGHLAIDPGARHG